jgi:hypothetical protein
MPSQLLKLYGGGFSPVSLSPSLWLDASDGATMYKERTGASATTLVSADADPVGTWRDKSGNARHLIAPSDAARPTFKVNIQNGRSVVQFDGADDVLSADSVASVFSGTNKSQSTFAVVKATTTNNRTFCGFGRNGNLTPIFLHRIVSASNTSLSYMRNDAGADLTLTGPSTALGTTYVYSMIYDGSQPYISISGTTGTPGSFTGTITLDRFTVGGQRRTNFEEWLNGQIMELIIYPSALSTSQRQQVERYLGNKWGVTLS